MFSKEWIENCSCSITTYETPAKVKNDNDEEETVEKNKKLDIKKMLISMKKRRGEE